MTTTDRSSNAEAAADADAAADAAVKAKHRAMWASGDYPALAHDLIAELGPALVDACGVRPGMRVLDVAAGAGNAALVAADADAEVVAADLTPELFAAGRAAAAERGVEVTWREADAEALPFADEAFDVVMSCVGVMFAPHHQQAADELVRVCRPGGTIGLLNWTPGGFIGQVFALMKPYGAAPPPGAQPPPLWGDERHVAALLGDRVERLQARRQSIAIPFVTGAEFRDYFKKRYGPTIAVYRNLGADAERAAELDRALAELGDQNVAGTTTMSWEYQLMTAVRI
jgi:ubiquinone/menaquinone biosynthesis C-methylase UbiE